MTDYNRILVVENGETILIQDENGNIITFSSFDEALSITGFDFSGKFYIGYEPHIGLFKDSRDPKVSEKNIPCIQYEDFINNIGLYKTRQSDPIYGLDKTSALVKSREIQKSKILTKYQLEEDLLVFTSKGISYSASPNHIVEIYVEYELAVLNDETVVQIFDTDNRPHLINIDYIVPTLQSMRVLAKDLRLKMKSYLLDINESSTIPDVKNVVWVS